jgi:hypothetical protein
MLEGSRLRADDRPSPQTDGAARLHIAQRREAAPQDPDHCTSQHQFDGTRAPHHEGDHGCHKQHKRLEVGQGGRRHPRQGHGNHAPGCPQPAVPRPSRAGTVETSPSPSLLCLSRPCCTSLRAPAAGSRWGRSQRRQRGAAGGGVWPGGGAKKGFGFLIRKDRARLYVPVACYGTRDAQAAAALRCGAHRTGCSILVCDAACILVLVHQYRRTVTSNEKSS